MSTQRRREDAGRVRPADLPRGPEGRALCRFCLQEVPPGRRSFCRDACVHEWKVQTQPRYVRLCLKRRDKGVCALCGRNVEKLRRELLKLPYAEREARRLELGMPPFSRSWWEGDHIVPVSEGGGLVGIEGYRTLCTPCHHQETAALRKRLAEKKRAEKEQQDGV